MDSVPEEECCACGQQGQEDDEYHWILLIEQRLAKSLASMCNLSSSERSIDSSEAIREMKT